MIFSKKLLSFFLTASLLWLTLDSHAIGINKSNWVSAMANLPPPHFPPTSTGNSPGFCLELDEQGMLYIGVYTFMLQPTLTAYPPMHIQYDIPGITGGVSAEFTGNNSIQTIIDDIPMYAHYLILSIDLNAACENAPPPQYLLPISYTISLVTPEGGGSYMLYPTYEYPDLWDPSIFPEADPSNWQPPVLSGTKYICCFGSHWTPVDNEFSEEATPETHYLATNSERQATLATPSLINNNEVELTSIPREVRLEGIKIFPNPFSVQLKIQIPFSLDESCLLEVFNTQGVKIYDSHFEENEIFISTDDWLTGVYFLRITSGDYSDLKTITKL